MKNVYTLSRPIEILSYPLSETKTGQDQPAKVSSQIRGQIWD